MALHLEIVTPKGSVVDVQAAEVILPGLEGEFGVLDGHIPFLSALRPGVVRYSDEQGSHRLATGSGFSQVGTDSKLLVLTDEHALPDQIDLDQARAELAELEGKLKDWTGELTGEHKELQERAQWAQARIDTLGTE